MSQFATPQALQARSHRVRLWPPVVKKNNGFHAHKRDAHLPAINTDPEEGAVLRPSLEQDGRYRLEARRLRQRRGEDYELGVTPPCWKGPVKTQEAEGSALCCFL